MSACVQQDLPNAWSVPEHQTFLGVAADDPWCGYMAYLRQYLDGAGPKPGDEQRDAALPAVRAEAKDAKDGDPFGRFARV